MKKEYSWQRYWYKNGDSPHLINGFLYASEYLNNVFTLDSKSDIKCLILLGEPGTGKSSEIKRIYESQIEDEKNIKRYFDLSSYGDESRLIREIFDSKEIEDWKGSDSNLYLYLDSLDEALLNINTLALLLADEIIKLPKERLFLRLACRTAEWSNLVFLENKLKEVWQGDDCQVLQIAPLQQKDIKIVAQSENFDGEAFLNEVYSKNVSVLAAKPITLRLLVNLFEENGSFPSTQTELYEKGCLTLCVENNERRQASKRIGSLSSKKRFIIAARIAALMIFCNKSSVRTGSIADKENSDIHIDELSGFTEEDNGEFQVTDADIREVVSDTGLFIGDGNNRLKFSHQTFAEFLASWYLQYRKVSNDFTLELIGEKYLYPQLYETSAWIANQNQTVFQHLMRIAPKVLLRSDIFLAEDSTKEKLVDILLDLFDKEESEGIDRSYYRKLKHPRLAEQLRPYISDKTKGWLVRSEALDMAQVCEVKELQDDFADIALDKNDNYDIRVHSAYAVNWLADSKTQAKLKPLIFGNKENDPKSRLKGVALETLWGECVTAEELFSVLSPPSDYFTGSYEVFLSSEMVEKLKVDDLPIALDWLIENISSFGYAAFSERRLADEILFKAWENLEQKEVLERFIKIAIKLITQNEDIFKELEDEEKINKVLNDKDNRRLIWLTLFLRIDEKLYW